MESTHYVGRNLKKKKVLQGEQAATLQRALGWKGMAGMTMGLQMSPTPWKGSKAHSVCSSE
jgi:hypothetical protein